MSESEEESFCFFGKPLDPYDEDSFPKKKPIAVEEQIATDAQGRRRFHGAFTGGFSAGFFNTVGSLEGWKPTEFKSTRQEKAQAKAQRPEDFMDDEDMGEFGIAPQQVRATSDFASSKKRKRQVFNDGPIPGEPLLHSLLTSGNETIGYMLLKNIGLKGKHIATEGNESPDHKVYGCEMPKNYEITRDDTVIQYEIAPIYREFLANPKNNTFGLGYVGLDRSHVNLFQSAELVVNERNKKKLSIRGQAFGVGAFEDDDEEIYVKDDMSKYDFELTKEKVTKKEALVKGSTIFDDFLPTKNILPPKPVFAPPTIPQSFTGKHKIKKSRFAPITEEKPPPEIARKDMNPQIRAEMLGEAHKAPEKLVEIKTVAEPIKEPKKEIIQEKTDLSSSFASAGLVFDRFVSASTPEDTSNILEEVKRSETEHGTQEMRDAAKMKMFGPLTRITSDWQPCSLLCKRFNVPEPNVDELSSSRNRKRTKNLIFQYEQTPDLTINDLKPGLTVNKAIKIENGTEPIEEPSNEAVEPPKVEDSNIVIEIPPKDEGPPPKDITEKLDVDKNIDLFKAVFLSSSESEDEEDAPDKSSKDIEMKVNILSETLVPTMKPVEEPKIPQIKPLKDGILSNMDFSSMAPLENNLELESKEDVGSYGPSLPRSFVQKPIELSKFAAEDNDDWVEAGHTRKDKKSKVEHKKKHKNKKSSHKKKHKRSKD